ncbi:carbohydrate ABC transporter permease [Oceanispirochaeta sp.]|uniref:carbohydrate ABC transporter permease n=1 Tax=Oceanispirochaeta sp. TaxID=2035350 RepID=UPI00263946B8|nr:sugar ABC transporter permease [Oceanispirochaeta sp.]MDA3957585.1 sugar ABC transporter permease [Oceanispirochaeta sp.]
MNSKKTIFVLVLPGLAVMVFAILAPILLSVYYSMTNWSGFGAKTFVGLANYKEVILQDKTFWRSLYNALILLGVTIFIQNVLAFLLASVLIKLSEKLSLLLRTIYFIPAILTVVVISKLWVNIMNPNYGLLNKVLNSTGLGSLAHSWLSEPKTALGAVIFITVWHGFGWALLFYYSGLTTVPKELEEAALVDGAGPVMRYMKVVIPYMMPVISAVIIIDIIACLKQMEVVMLTTSGGPGNMTQFVAYHLYEQAFKYSRYGYGNAISILFVIIALTITLLAKKFLSGDNGND